MKKDLEKLFDGLKPEQAEGLFDDVKETELPQDVKSRIESKIRVNGSIRPSGRKRLLKSILPYAAALVFLSIVITAFALIRRETYRNDDIPVQSTSYQQRSKVENSTVCQTDTSSFGSETYESSYNSETYVSNASSESGNFITGSSSDRITQTEVTSLSPASATERMTVTTTISEITSDTSRTEKQTGSEMNVTDADPTITQTNPSETSYIGFDNMTFDADAPAEAFYGEDVYSFSAEAPCIIDDGLCAFVKAVCVSKDTYRIYGDQTQGSYFIVKFKIKKMIFGSCENGEFYTIIPMKYYTDLTQYPKILIYDLHQIAFDKYVIYNETKGAAEQLSLPLMGEYSDGESTMKRFVRFSPWKYIPYREGKADLTLWDSNPEWKKRTEKIRDSYLEDYGTTDDAINEILSYRHREEEYCTVMTLDKYVSESEKKLLEYVSDPESGVFVQPLHFDHMGCSSCILTFTRYINGFPTDEQYVIYITVPDHGGDHAKPVYSEIVYTESDIARLPDLSSGFFKIKNDLSGGTIGPPHLTDGDKVASMEYGLTARYVKQGDSVYGLIRAGFLIEIHGGEYFIDDRYFIVYENGEMKDISRDELLTVIPSSPFVYKGEYGDNGISVLLYVC